MDAYTESMKEGFNNWYSNKTLVFITGLLVIAYIVIAVYFAAEEKYADITFSPRVESFNPEDKKDAQLNSQIAKQTAYALQRRGGLVVRDGEIEGGAFESEENEDAEGTAIDKREFGCGGTCGFKGKGLEIGNAAVGLEEFQGEGEDREIAKQTAYALERRGGLVIREGDIEGGSFALAENEDEEGAEIDKREFDCGGTCGVKGKGLETGNATVGVEEFAFGLEPVHELYASPYGDGHYTQKNCMGVY